MKNRIAGIVDEEEDDEEFEYVGGGREPIPKRPRPAIPERPANDPGSADEDDMDDGPQVVVLKEGKHLTALEAENIKRKGLPNSFSPSDPGLIVFNFNTEKGLPPLPDPDAIGEASDAKKDSSKKDNSTSKSSSTQGLSFSSSSKQSSTSKSSKRKAIGLLGDTQDDSKASDEGKGPAKKKMKKQNKKLLSFGDDA